RDVLAGIETGRLRRAVFLSPETRRLALPSWTRGAHMGTGIELFLQIRSMAVCRGRRPSRKKLCAVPAPFRGGAMCIRRREFGWPYADRRADLADVLGLGGALDAEHLDALVVGQLLADRCPGHICLTVHEARTGHRILFGYLDHVNGIGAIALAQIGRNRQRADQDQGGEQCTLLTPPAPACTCKQPGRYDMVPSGRSPPSNYIHCIAARKLYSQCWNRSRAGFRKPCMEVLAAQFTSECIPRTCSVAAPFVRDEGVAKVLGIGFQER